MSDVVPSQDLFEFFLDRVKAASRHQGGAVSENAVYYLTQLLAEEGRREATEETTLAELRLRAAQAPRAEAVTLWKRLGDNSLMVTGFFREQLTRKRLPRAYYATMGAAAYAALAHSLAGPPGGFGEVFDELSQRWDRCADVIAEVRDETRELTDGDILRLYEEWLVSGSPRVAERLRQLGVVPARTGGVA